MAKAFNILSRVFSKRFADWKKREMVGLSWLKEKRLKHDLSNHLKQYRLFGRPLFYVSSQDLLHGIKEIFIDECYKIDLRDKPYILDCGGNIGLSVLYLNRNFPTAEIVTFEPDKVNQAILEKNIQSFGLSNVSLRTEAVWIEDTEVNFAGEGSLGSSIHSAESSVTYKVQSISLSKFIDRQISLLKLDIEGAEYEVMKDIEPKLSLVDNIFLEYHSTFEERYKLVELLDIVQKAGFYFYLREVFNIYPTPFYRAERKTMYDIQLNIYCFRK